MRIIAGSRRGVRLAAHENADIRPTPDMVRESLFNIIGQDMSGIRFLDLFAGTGAVGLEAVSRGAELCVLVDSSRAAIDLCRRNAHHLLFTDRVEILHMDASAAVGELSKRGERFEVVFAGPPFKMSVEYLLDLSSNMAGSFIMPDAGVFIIQLPARIKSFEPQGFTLIKQRKYGKNNILFFNR